ncbi:SNF2-related protein [Thaumasiovibrio sp. DFM-14]|uniref:SNF2-related protein n=1 Tax=Thaumasiovibrio sp. DFM-14 TaxID=3384792 RepID=UPI0039A3C018
MTIEKLRMDVAKCTSIDDVLAIFDRYYRPTKNNPEFGITQEKISLARAKKLREAANREAKVIIDRVNGDSSQLTDDDRQVLARYSGLGGIGETISEYYTPQFVAEGIWDALKENGFENGNVLEPSAGAGVFNGTKPDSVIMTATEIDETSSAVNRLLHPEDEVRTTNFEKLAVDTPDNTFDSVVGNVPFGDSRGTFANDDPEYAGFSDMERYFVTRSIDKVKPGGLVALIVPPRIVDRTSWEDWRVDLSYKCEFLGAHRLPTGLFNASGTETVTDLLILRKHSKEVAQRINDVSYDTLKEAKVIWDTWTKGKWFKSSRGKKFIQGDMSIEGKDQFKRLVVKNHQLTNQAIKKQLSKKLKSRIDYKLLNASETVITNYSEGDRALINSRWHEMKDGQWQKVRFADDSGKINADSYGASSINELKLLMEDPINALSLEADQLSRIANDMPYIFNDSVKRSYELAKKQDPKHFERVFRGSIIGTYITELQTGSSSMSREKLASLVHDEFEKYGPVSHTRKLVGLTGRHSNTWNQFANGINADGQLSALLSGTIEDDEGEAYDSTNLAETLNYLFTQRGMNPVDPDELSQWYTGDSSLDLKVLANDESIAIRPDGMIEPMERYCSGEVSTKVSELQYAMASQSDPILRDKFATQLARIREKQPKINPDDIQFRLNSKWFDRKVIRDFLKTQGMSFDYSEIEENSDGEIVENTETDSLNGVFSGYRLANAKGGQSLSNSKYPFESQMELYINGMQLSGALAGRAGYMNRINRLEEEFNVWVRQQDDFDELVQEYQDTFNDHIEFEHSDATLGLDDLSGNIVPMPHQNAAVRKLSEDGKGICAFDTGLGKTFTAMALAAHNRQQGRAYRTCIAVPKSVIEKWYHDAVDFYGTMDDKLVIPIEPVRGKDGGIETVPVLDKDGNQATWDDEGLRPKTRHKIRHLSAAEIADRMNSIPHSNYSTVIMTKEQLAAIPMMPETKDEYVTQWVDREMLSKSGALKAVVGTDQGFKTAKTYKEAKQKSSFQAKYSKDQTAKADAFPYWEAMRFDSLMMDEAHNYRNSYQAGRRASNIQYLPSGNTAQTAVDCSMKAEHIRAKTGGRGIYPITATPTVNSPMDVFNMLTLTLGADAWAKYGIATPDDFVNVFAETESVPVTKLNGKIEMLEGLTGFKNLHGLRSIFHRHIIFKNAKDVSAHVKIPEVIDKTVEVPLTDEQQALYEELRVRADAISKNSDEIHEVDEDDEGNENKDTVFGIIRDMDRVCTDIDLYYRQITFKFQLKDKSKVLALVKDLPDVITQTRGTGEKKESFDTAHEAKTTSEGKTFVLVLNELFENEVSSRLDLFDIDESTVGHNVTPKYAACLQDAKKAYQKGGKHIIFTEEKSQHNKIKRLLTHVAGIPADEIAIINADTVVNKTKKDTVVDLDSAQDFEAQAAGMEAIAAAYNAGKYRVIIANKTAEVGVDLHINTTNVSHLTLPWTPASVRQRNGRAARVNSPQDSVDATYYVAKGSFDTFRLDTLKVKANWQDELINGDQATMKNEDADTSFDADMMIAKDPESRAQIREENLRKAKEKVEAANRKRARIDVANFLRQSRRNNNIDELTEKLNDQTDKLEAAQEAGANKEIIASHRSAISSLNKDIKLAGKMLGYISATKNAIADGNAPADILERGAEMVMSKDGSTYYSVGEQIEWKESSGNRNYRDTWTVIGRITDTHDHNNTVTVEVLYNSSSYRSPEVGTTTTRHIDYKPKKTAISSSDVEFMTWNDKRSDYKRLIQAIRDGVMTKERWPSVQLTHGIGSCLHHDEDGSFVVKYSSDAETLVYPDPDDKALKERIATWAIAERRKEAGNYFTGPTDLYIEFFGPNYDDVLESMGDQAPQTAIDDAVAKAIHHVLNDAESKQVLLDQKQKDRDSLSTILGPRGFHYEYEFKSLARPHMKELKLQYDNRSAIDAALASAIKPYKKRWIEEHKAELAAVKAEAEAAMAAEAEAERLRVEAEQAEQEAERQRLEALAVKVEDDQASTPTQSDLTEHANDNGIVIRKNTAPVTIGRWLTKTGKVKREGELREVGTMIGIHDPDGIGGKLHQARKELKPFKAKFGNDASDEFPGGWWFIEASQDIEAVLSVIN